MTGILVLEQSLNGLQFGLMLFLLAAGLTLVFGIMDMINLAHGSIYMIGAYLIASMALASGSFWLGLALGIAATAAIGALLELTVLRRLYQRDHLSQVLGTKINIATVSSCSGGRLEDLRVAAHILKGRKVHPEVRMVVAPASQKIYQEAMKDGTFSTLLEAGVLIGHATCGPCHGGQLVVLGKGDVCIGSLPRNMQGRMGSPESEIYSANPAVVAASAIKGVIADPKEFL